MVAYNRPLEEMVCSSTRLPPVSHDVVLTLSLMGCPSLPVSSKQDSKKLAVVKV
jgi:hypothetical protein